jgi:hypothetical protein
MADRVLRVTILGDAGSAVTALGQTEAAAGSLEQRVGGVSGALSTLSPIFASIGVATAGLFVGAVSSAADFEQTMSNVKAVSGETGAAFDQMKQLALEMGAQTAFSAGEAAQGLEELLKGGLSTEDAMDALKSTLDLAAAGEISVADAATIASNAIAMFNLTGDDMTMVADNIAGAANASAISVGDFQQSLAAVGSVAAMAGQDFDEVATAIALMGQEGIKGSDAGTSLKTMLMNLIPTTNTAKEAFAELGITHYDNTKIMQALIDQGIDPMNMSQDEQLKKLYMLVTGWDGLGAITKEQVARWDAARDSMGLMTNEFVNADGSFKDLSAIAQVLNEKLAGMNETQKATYLEMMFGSDAIRAATILAEAGAVGFEGMAEAMAKVTAADVAAAKLDNLKGAIEALKGSLETIGIIIGSMFLPVLRELADGLTWVANQFITLDPAMQTTIATIALVAGAVAGAVGAWGMFGPQIMAAAQAFVYLAGVLGGPLLIAAAAAGAIWLAWDTNFLGIRDRVNETAAALERIIPSLANQAWATFSGILADLQTVWTALDPTTFNDALERLPAPLAAAVLGLGQLLAILRDVQAVWVAVDSATFNDALERLPGPVAAAVLAVGELLVALDGLRGTLDQVVSVLARRDFIGGGWLAEDSPIVTGLFAIRDAAAGILERLDPLVARFDALRQSADPLGTALAQVRDYLQGLYDRVVALDIPWRELSTAFSVGSTVFSVVAGILGGPLTVAILGVAAVVGALYLAWTNDWGGIRGAVDPVLTTLQQLGAWVTGTAIPAFQQFGATLLGIWQGEIVPLATQFAAVIQGGVGGAMAALIPLVQQLGATFQANLPAILELGDQLRQTWAALQPLLEPLAYFLGGVMVVQIGFLMGALGGLVGFLGGVLPGAIQAATGVLQVFEGIFTWLSATVTGVINVVSALLRGDWAGAWDAAKQAAWDAAAGVQQIFEGLKNTIIGIFNGLAGGILGALQGFWNTVIGFFQGIYRELVGESIIPDLINKIVEWFGKLPGMVLAALGDLANTLYQKGRDLVGGLLNGIGEAWGTVASNFANAGASIAGYVGDLAGALVQKGRDLIGGFLAGVGEAWGTVATNFANVGFAIIGYVGDVAGALWQQGVDIVDGFTRGVWDKWQWVVTFFQDVGGSVLGFIGDTLTTLYGKGKDLGQGLVDGFRAALDGLKTHVTELFNWLVQEWNKLPTPPFPDLPVVIGQGQTVTERTPGGTGGAGGGGNVPGLTPVGFPIGGGAGGGGVTLIANFYGLTVPEVADQLHSYLAQLLDGGATAPSVPGGGAVTVN